MEDHAPAGARRPAVQLCAVDHGPGIADVTVALRDGFSTTSASLGAGLGTCLRISDAFDLYSEPGRGTVAVARIRQRPGARREPAGPGPRAGGVNVPLAHAPWSGDAWSWVRHGPHLTLMLADGLGHGAKAAHASRTAVDLLSAAAHLPPAEMLRHLHTALRRTRGAAVAVAQLDTGTAQLRFAGVGNVAARIRTGGTWRPLVSHPGIVGAHFPATVPVQHTPWPAGSLLVVHSDGLPSRWTPPDDPRLLTRDPAVVAAAVLRDASSSARPARDDTSVAVLADDPGTAAHDRP